VSTIFTLNVADPRLPLESEVEHVTVFTPNAKIDPDSGVHETFGVGPSTMSTAVGVGKLTFEPVGPFASVVISAGRSFSCGGVVSVTSTAKTAGGDVLFDASFAVHETCVVPSGNVSPELLSQDTVGEGSTPSAAVTAKVTAAPLGSVASAVIGSGTDRLGGVVSMSLTLTAKVAVDVFVPSLAEHVTVVVPTANVEPGGGEQFGVIDPATASVAVTGP
jgi:hypothetical protein